MIEILRLKNGEDIIGDVYKDTGDYEILEPMSVGIETRGREAGLVMQHWLPVQLIEGNKTTIKKEDVLTTFHPNNEFKEYYKNTIQKNNESIIKFNNSIIHLYELINKALRRKDEDKGKKIAEKHSNLIKIIPLKIYKTNNNIHYLFVSYNDNKN